MDKNIATAVEYVDIDLGNLTSLEQLNEDKLEELKFTAQGESVRIINAENAIVLANVLWAVRGLVDEIVIRLNGQDYLLLEESEKNALRSSRLDDSYCCRSYDLAKITKADQGGFEIEIRNFVKSYGNLAKAIEALDKFRYKYEVVRILTYDKLILETAATVVRVFYMASEIQIISEKEAG